MITDQAIEAGAEALAAIYKGPSPETEPFHLMAKAVLTGGLPHMVPVVKALEWTIERRNNFDIHIGRGLGLKYEAAIKVYSPGWIVTLGKSEVIFDGSDVVEEDARAAAQADYKRRVMSALDFTPSNTSPVVSHEGADGGDKVTFENMATPDALERRAKDFHPESLCTSCEKPNPTWHAPNDIWNSVMGCSSGVLCPTCFALRAAPEIIWRLSPVSPTPQPEPEVVAFLEQFGKTPASVTLTKGRHHKLPLIRQSDHLRLVSELREEVERLRVSNSMRQGDLRHFMDKADRAEARLTALKQENARLREAVTRTRRWCPPSGQDEQIDSDLQFADAALKESRS